MKCKCPAGNAYKIFPKSELSWQKVRGHFYFKGPSKCLLTSSFTPLGRSSRLTRAEAFDVSLFLLLLSISKKNSSQIWKGIKISVFCTSRFLTTLSFVLVGYFQMQFAGLQIWSVHARGWGRYIMAVHFDKLHPRDKNQHPTHLRTPYVWVLKLLMCSSVSMYCS